MSYQPLPSYQPSPPKPATNKGLIIGLVVAVFVIVGLIGLVVYFATRRGSTAVPSPSTATVASCKSFVDAKKCPATPVTEASCSSFVSRAVRENSSESCQPFVDAALESYQATSATTESCKSFVDAKTCPATPATAASCNAIQYYKKDDTNATSVFTKPWCSSKYKDLEVIKTTADNVNRDIAALLTVFGRSTYISNVLTSNAAPGDRNAVYKYYKIDKIASTKITSAPPETKIYKVPPSGYDSSNAKFSTDYPDFYKDVKAVGHYGMKFSEQSKHINALIKAFNGYNSWDNQNVVRIGNYSYKPLDVQYLVHNAYNYHYPGEN